MAQLVNYRDTGKRSLANNMLEKLKLPFRMPVPVGHGRKVTRSFKVGCVTDRMTAQTAAFDFKLLKSISTASTGIILVRINTREALHWHSSLYLHKSSNHKSWFATLLLCCPSLPLLLEWLRNAIASPLSWLWILNSATVKQWSVLLVVVALPVPQIAAVVHDYDYLLDPILRDRLTRF